MFEMFKEQFVSAGNIEGYIKEYNPETEKFVIVDENDKNKVLGEISLMGSGLIFNIDYWDDWENKLMSALIRNNGQVEICVYSTESADDCLFTIYRHKSLVNTHEYSDEIILITYFTYFAGEIKGNMLTRQHVRYAGCAIDEQKEFDEWIETQIEEVSEFNNTDYWDTFSGIVYFDGCFTIEEDRLLSKWKYPESEK